MNTFFVYIWTRIDDLRFCLVAGFVILAILGGITIIAALENTSDDGIKIGIGLITIGVFFAIVRIAIPTKSDLAIIYVAPKLANSEIITKDCPEIAKLGVEALKQQLKEITGTSTEVSKKKVEK